MLIRLFFCLLWSINVVGKGKNCTLDVSGCALSYSSLLSFMDTPCRSVCAAKALRALREKENWSLPLSREQKKQIIPLLQKIKRGGLNATEKNLLRSFQGSVSVPSCETDLRYTLTKILEKDVECAKKAVKNKVDWEKQFKGMSTHTRVYLERAISLVAQNKDLKDYHQDLTSAIHRFLGRPNLSGIAEEWQAPGNVFEDDKPSSQKSSPQEKPCSVIFKDIIEDLIHKRQPCAQKLDETKNPEFDKIFDQLDASSQEFLLRQIKLVRTGNPFTRTHQDLDKLKKLADFKGAVSSKTQVQCSKTFAGAIDEILTYNRPCVLKIFEDDKDFKDIYDMLLPSMKKWIDSKIQHLKETKSFQWDRSEHLLLTNLQEDFSSWIDPKTAYGVSDQPSLDCTKSLDLAVSELIKGSKICSEKILALPKDGALSFATLQESNRLRSAAKQIKENKPVNADFITKGLKTHRS